MAVNARGRPAGPSLPSVPPERAAALRIKYARLAANPHLRRLGAWREANDDAAHDDAAYLRRGVQIAPEVGRLLDAALEGL